MEKGKIIEKKPSFVYYNLCYNLGDIQSSRRYLIILVLNYFAIQQIFDLNQSQNKYLQSQFMKSQNDQNRVIKHIINNLYANTIATEDLLRFRKVASNSWQSIRSSRPLSPGIITQFTVQILAGDSTIMIGVGAKNDSLMSSQYFGQMPNTVSFYCNNGTKYFNGSATEYGKKANIGDTVTTRVNLSQGEGYVQYLINDNSLGKAFGGLNEWENVYFGLSLATAGVVVKIVDQKISA